jgi:hypothetical protein
MVRLSDTAIALRKIPGEGIKTDQEDCKNEHPRVSTATGLSSLDQVGDRGTKEKHLQGRAETRRNLNERQLIQEGNEEDSAADHGGCQAQSNGEDVLAPARRLRLFAHPVMLPLLSLNCGCLVQNDFIVAFHDSKFSGSKGSRSHEIFI